MVLTGNAPDLMTQVTYFLASKFKIKDLGTLKYFLGIKIARSFAGIYFNQRKYSLDILRDVDFLDAKPIHVPVDQNHNLIAESTSPMLTNVYVY